MDFFFCECRKFFFDCRRRFFQEEQQKLMEYLEEKERLRERKLRLQGIIPDDNEEERTFPSKPKKQTKLNYRKTSSTSDTSVRFLKK